MATEYIRHFGMTETPFARNHDPRWLYLSTQHKEAVIKARWTIEEHGGLALIRGDVGQGKSFLVEYLGHRIVVDGGDARRLIGQALRDLASKPD